MAARFAIVFLAAVLIFQVMLLDATIIRRDVPTDTKSASQTVDDAFQSLKTSLDDLVKNIQENELLHNVSQSLKSFGEKIQTQGNELVQKLQSNTNAPN